MIRFVAPGVPDKRCTPVAAGRQQDILDMRAAGVTFGEIGAALGCSKQYAHAVVKRWEGTKNGRTNGQSDS